MSRRSPGEGSISRRKDGRWQASLQVNGQRTTVYGKTRGEAAAKLRVLQSQAPAPTVNLTLSKRTLNELLSSWLEVRAHEWKPTTLLDYRKVCETHLQPALGIVRLSRLSPDRIERFLAGYHHQPKTALKCYGILNQTLRFAVRWGWLGTNPCDRVDAPRYQPQRKAIWTVEEARRFLSSTKEHWLGSLWTFLAHTGCRISEALALEWADVNLVTGTVHICKNLQRVDGEWVTTQPKTQAGVRTITVAPEAIAALGRQAERRLAQGGGSLVFAGKRGTPLHATTVAHAMGRECERLDLPRMTPHGLRHLHASLLVAEGVSLPAVGHRLGHANSSVTLATYTHLLYREEATALAAIAAGLGTDGTSNNSKVTE